MPLRVPIVPSLARMLAVPEGESEPRYQATLTRQIRRGMVVTASLGLTAVVVFIGTHLATGSQPVWIHAGSGNGEVSLADKTFIAAVCVALLAAARRPGVRGWGRPLLGVVMVASGLAMALDDVARGDFTFTVAWLVLAQLVAVGTVPFTPRHALAISLAMLGVYLFALWLHPGGIPEHLYEHRLAYYLFATIIVVTLAHYLYRARYGQHRALADAEDLRDVLADRTRALERSLVDLGEAQNRLVRQERLAALGQVTTGVAHEIQNPLNFVTNFAALTRELATDLRTAYADGRGDVEDLLDDLDLNVTSIHEHGRRAAQVVDRMMEHARVGGDGRLVEVDLNAFVAECLGDAERRLSGRLGAAAPAVEVRQKYRPEVARSSVDPREMAAVLHNLLDNAFRAALEGTHGQPTVFVETARTAEGVEIRVADNGPGIPEAVHDRLFEPFFTTRSPGEGTGLGLSLAYEAVTHGHRGALAVEPRPGGGAVFVVRLPTPPAP